VTGASSTATRPASRSFSARIASGPTVDMSIRAAPGGRVAARPSGPNTTSSSDSGPASMVMAASASLAASAGVAAATAPLATASASRPGVRFQTRTWCPAAASRVAMGAPITPSPQKASVAMVGSSQSRATAATTSTSSRASGSTRPDTPTSVLAGGSSAR
jgi:hypothetical protein